MDPILIPVGTVLVVIAIGGLRWLMHLQRVADDHAERISWLEAKTNGKHREGE